MRKVVVEFVHFKDDIVGHLGLGEQDVHVPGHAARHGMDAEANVDTLFAQQARDLVDRVLRLRHRHAITRDDDHILGLAQQLASLRGADRNDLTGRLRSTGRRRGSSSGSPEAAGDDADEVAIHRRTHDVRKDRAARSDQRASDDQQVVGEHEAGRRRCPARVAVQHRDHHRHVGAADRHDHVDAEEQGDDGHHDQRGHAVAD